MTNSSVSPEEAKDQLQHIVASPTFSKKRSLIKTLSFLVAKSLESPSEDLTGKRIAQDGFGKGAEFDNSDSSVRVAMTRLRKALQEYYHSKGRRDAIIISLPKTGYHLTFQHRSSAKSQSVHQPTKISLEVRKLCKEGWHHVGRRVGEALWRALEHFEEAARLEPTHVEAYSGIAHCCVLLNVTGEMSGIEGQRRAGKALGSGSLQKKDLARLLTSSATVHALFGWQWQQAEIEFRRALRLKATATAHFNFASFCLLPQGELEEAEREIHKALDLEENSPRIMLHKNIILYAQGRYPLAIQECATALKMHPDFGGFQFWLGRIYAAQGNYAKAVAALKESWDVAPLVATKGHWSYCCGCLGDNSEAERLLRDLEAASLTRYVPPHAFALANLGLGRTEAVFNWLERGIVERDAWVPLLLNVDPWLWNLRGNDRIQNYLKLIGLAPSLQ
jgi:tetratricopeptide (TPR) repeat protein